MSLAKITVKLILITILLAPSISFAEGKYINHRANVDNILSNLSNLNPSQIRPLSNTSMYIINIDDKEYITDINGKFLVDFNDYFEVFDNGGIINTPSSKVINEAAYSLLNNISRERLIVHKPDQEKTDSVFVFMDYTCPFCQQFHHSIKNEFLDHGVEVVYLPFRRSNESRLFENNKSIFCQKDNDHKIDLYENIISNRNTPLEERTQCEYPSYYEFIEKTLVSLNHRRITPLVVGSNGIVVEGLRDFKEYKKIIGLNIHEKN